MNQCSTRPEDINLVIFDVDGVLTDGTLYYGEKGEVVKAFNVKDGVGFRLLKGNGIEVAVITAKASVALSRRMLDLKVKYFFPSCHDKLLAFNDLKSQLNIANNNIAYVGDDVVDLLVMRKVGMAIAPLDAHAQILKVAHVVTKAAGGKGVVREVADLLVGARTSIEKAYDKLVE